MMFEIKLADSSVDLQELALVHKCSKLFAYPYLAIEINKELHDIEQLKERWDERLLSADYRIIIAMLNSVIVGFSAATQHNSQTAELTHLYVKPNCWRQGLGSKLESSLLSILKSEGMEEIHLWTLEGGLAEKFYEKNSYLKTGIKKPTGYQHNIYKYLIQLIKSLNYCY